ncbi:GntR family transcriptional regulator [Enemella evansiae]|uniref:GntR family transcriptional regulator n=1 Tax=Enemella evansiae TaxID=2016499 RepID=UPI000C00F138|nr:GntR family transcriptional regulator [Enemella evansiae]PFG66197.1 DNA-binding GntR family transcriptional regulator [Propionibacteriaceae bacterium ES.041]TDO86054.1 GntR family transcriptional regulator [Enemella evansiae]
MTTTAQHGATGARIAETLRADILAERYAPGERLRPDEIAEASGASRLPVREALRMLEGEGLITLVANTGAWVSSLSPEEYQELYQMRERLEPLLLRLNVPALGDDQIDELERLAETMERSDDVETFLELDRAFHLSCLESVPTIVLHETVVSLWNRTQHYRRRATRLFYEENNRVVHHDHFLIVNAMRQRDAEEAERVLAGHIRRSRLQLAKHPEVFTSN